jgi:DNA-binding beta-propeller fold protein YncE
MSLHRLGFTTAVGAVILFMAGSAGAAELKQIGALKVPGTPLDGYDISFVDQSTNRYYLADRTNKGVDIFDVNSGEMIDRLPGFVGQQKSNDTSGPNGVLVIGNELWAGDGDSTVKIFDLTTKKLIQTVSTGGKARVDEMSYDPKAHAVLMANNADDPPFATIVSAAAGHNILAKIVFADATDGIEQSVYDAKTDKFYMSVPELKGDKAKGGVAVIEPAARIVEKILPVEGCHPAGLVHGPGNNLLLGCTAGSTEGGLPAEFVVMSTDGDIVKVIPGIGAADMVAYNPKLERYYTASRDMPEGPELGVIDARTNTLVQRIAMGGGNPHSVAVSEANNHVFVPLAAKGGGCDGCIAVFAPAPNATSGPYALVTGRRDPRVIVVDIGKAIDPANNGTRKAIINKVRISPDVPAIEPSRTDAKYIGVTRVPAQALPNNIIVPPGGKAYVVDHAGVSRPADVESGMPHGYPGALTVLDVKKALDQANNNTTNAIDAIYYSGGYGPAGVIVTPDNKYAMIANSEGAGNEDGANEIGVINLTTKRLERVALLARGTGGHVPNTPGHSCDEIYLNPALVPHISPDPNWGCFSDPNGLAYTPRQGGYVFSANEGTHDVSVINVAKAVSGAPDWETFRIPVERGPWAIVASPDGSLVALTNRDDDETDEAGRFISIIDVDKAIAKSPDAEVRRVLVGTDNPKGESHPFSLAFTPDDSRIVVANDLAANVSIVDVKKALAGDEHPEIARIPLALPSPTSGNRPRPRAVSVTPDGQYAIIAGGEPNTKAGGSVWVVDLQQQKVIGTVTGVGNEPYLLAITTGE